MRYIPLLLFAICALRPAFSQVGINVRDTGRKAAVDTCRLRVIYRFRYARDTTGGPAWYDCCALEAGDRLSRYYSLYGDRIDSLYFRARMKRNASDRGFNPTAWMKPQHRAHYEDCYADYPEPGTLTVSTAVVRNEYRYEEPAPRPEWVLLPDTVDCRVLGYACRAAVARFRGREYTAWFTEEIPVARGPWKLGGLPGLILRAESADGLFAWEAVAIAQPAGEAIHDYDPQQGILVAGAPPMRIVRTDRAAVRKLQRMAWADPVGLEATFGIRSFGYDYTTDRLTELKSGDREEPYIPSLELE